MYPYPTSLSLDSVKNVVQKVKQPNTTTVSNATAWHSAWDLIGYGSSQLLPDTNVSISSAGNPESIIPYFEQLLAPVPEGAVSSQVAIPWQLILPVLVQLAEYWLKHLGDK